LVQAAGIDSHDDAYDFLIDRVSKATGCSDERIFLVPGNHDLSHASVLQHDQDHRKWRGALGRPDELSQLNEWYEEKAFDTAVAAKFSNYFDLERYLGGDDRRGSRRVRTSFATVDHIEALNIDLVLFNTAVFSTGGHKAYEPDERQLAVPEYAIIEAMQALTQGSFRIFATHHPFSMLSEHTARLLEGEITKHAHVHLFGHMHDPQPKKIVGLKGELLSNQAGAIFTARRTAYIGYALITIDRSKPFAETLIRSYFDDRKEFDDGIDVIEGGRWWSSQEAKQHFRKIATPVDERKFREHLAGPALDALSAREAKRGGEGDLHERFVAPPLWRTFIQEVNEEEGTVEVETPVSFSDLVIGDSNLILYGRPEYGRTTLLRELRFKLLADAHVVRYPRLPLLLEFSEVSANADNVLRKARGGAETLPSDHDLESLLKLGHACVLVDDVHFADVRAIIYFT
jgi:predicted phosphodiesterase